MFGRTTNSLGRNLGWARKAIFSFSFVPLDLIAWLALVCVGMAFTGIVVQVILRLLDPTLTPTGFTTLIILILFMGGIQLLCLSIIGSYLAHIYDEVKGRPPFIVESILNRPTHGSNNASSDHRGDRFCRCKSGTAHVARRPRRAHPGAQ
jgi:dolichol-phosphate mannosyltransferase